MKLNEGGGGITKSFNTIAELAEHVYSEFGEGWRHNVRCKKKLQTLHTIISKSPDRPNIYYEIRDHTENDIDMSGLVKLLRSKLINTPRVVVYCQSLDTCSNQFAHFVY